MRKNLLFATVALVLAGAAAVVWLGDSGGTEVMAAQPDDVVLGNVTAPVRVVVYVAPTCAPCGAFHRDVVPRLKAQWLDTGRAVLVYRNAPTSDVDFAVSKFLRCMAANRPDRMLAWIDVLFRDQPTWLTAADPVQGLQRAGRELDRAGYDRLCLDNPLVEENVLRARDAAADAGVRSVPAIFVEGRRVAADQVERALAALVP